MSENHLKIENLSHQYNSYARADWALKSVNLSLLKGELIGLLGPSGCGKTTLLRLIAGFEKPSQGFISISNQIVSSPHLNLPPEKRGVGMVFQDCALFPHLDAWKNVCFGIRRGGDFGRASWLLDLLGLSDFRHRYPHELSGGQRQRLALARALAPGTSLVLLDEPFSNLDVEVRLKLRSELSRVLKSCQASALLVTHDPQEALAICDKVAVMRNGELHQCSSPKELVLNPKTSFVGRFVLQRNLLPVQLKGVDLITPIGLLPSCEQYQLDKDKDKDLSLIFDEYSLQIEPHSSGESKIIAREFQGSYWVVKVLVSTHILRIWLPLDQPLNVGDRCNVNFRKGKKGILFPGALSVDLAQ